MDAVSGSRPLRPFATAAPAAAAPTPAPAAPAAAAPADAAQLSGAPAPAAGPVGRAWLWTGLETAGLMGGAAVGGSIGAALSTQQTQALREVLQDLQANGVLFFVDKGIFGGVFGERYPDKNAEEVLQLILADKPDFSSKLWMRREGVETHKFRSLRALKQMDAFYGGGDPAGLAIPQAALALKELSNAGWSINLVQDSYDTSKSNRSGPFGAYKQFVENPATRNLTLTSPDGKTFGGLRASDLGAVHFFEGSGDVSSLTYPELGEKIKQVASNGYTLEPDDWQYERQGLRGVYQALEDGQSVSLKLGELTLGKIKGHRAQDLDDVMNAARDQIELYEKILLPEAKAGRLYQDSLGAIMTELNHSVTGHSLEDRMELFGELARAVRSGPDKGQDLRTQTRQALETYERIRKQGHTGEEFSNAILMSSGLITQVGSEQADDAIKYLTEDLPKASPYPEARREQEAAFLRLMRASGNVESSIATAPMVDVRLGSESREDRLKILEGLARAGRHQAGYANLGADYQAMLSARLPDQSLEDASKVYTLLLGALARAGKAEETAVTYRFLQDGLRFGRFKDETPMALTDRYISTLLLTRDPKEARDKLLDPAEAGKEPGTIEEGESSVDVGGVVLPKKDRSAAAA